MTISKPHSAKGFSSKAALKLDRFGTNFRAPMHGSALRPVPILISAVRLLRGKSLTLL
jgi:hypothetical protein